MENLKIIDSGCRSCPFLHISMDGIECNHPYYKDRGAYNNMIINSEQLALRIIPQECPLRKEELIITYKLKDL
jgi:hypothetical protein